MNTGLKELILVFLLFFIIGFFGSKYLLLSLPKKLCENKYSSYTVDYTFMSGCRVKVNDKWVPVENLRQV